MPASRYSLRIEHLRNPNRLSTQRHGYRRRSNGRKLGGPGEFHVDQAHALDQALRTSGVTRDPQTGALSQPYYASVDLVGWTPSVVASVLESLDA